MTAPVEPGIYTDLSYAEYDAIPAKRSSHLIGPEETPAHKHHAETHPEDTRPLRLGIAGHVAILEPHLFVRRYTERAKARGTGSRAVNAAAKAEAQSQGLTELEPDEMRAVEHMRRAVLTHRIAGPLLERALARELSIVWRDGEHGVLCKARLDALAEVDGQTCVVDLKTTSMRAGSRAWRSAAWTFGYYRQAAWYLAGAAAVEPEDAGDRGWLWVVVESEPPHCVVVYRADEELLSIGYDECRAGLARRLEAERTGEWPGYPDEIQTLQAPRWLNVL